MNDILVWLHSTTGEITVVTAFITAVLLFIEHSKKIVFRPLSKLADLLFGWLHKTDHERMDMLENTLTEFMKVSAESDEKIINIIQGVEDSIRINEKDRIRNIIFSYGRVARSHGHITTDEWRYIQDLYYKYHNDLGGNGQVTEEYDFVKGYYYSQFEKGAAEE